jgi:threonine synthase
VQAFAVTGTFDDCQALAKAAFADETLKRTFELVSANSINVGRILPQSVYYAWASLEYETRTGRPAGFAVPTGNLGNALSALWARAMGFPIREIALCLNANRPLAEFLSTGSFRPAPAIATLANAMDVGNPSNFERLVHLVPELRQLATFVRAESFHDDAIRDAIRDADARWGVTLCPHSATAYAFARKIESPDWIVVATAHPAKFETIVEPLIGREVPVPPALAEILERPGSAREIAPVVDELRRAIGP